MRLLGAVIFLILLAAGAYLLPRRDALPGLPSLPSLPSSAGGTAGVTISPDTAASGEAKLELLQLDMEEAWLSGAELTSLFVYRPDVWNAGPLSSPIARISRDTLSLSGTISPSSLPDFTGVDELRRMLPDTVRVALAGTVGPLAGGDAVIHVTRAEVAGVPVPSFLLSAIVERMGLPGGEGIPEAAFVLPLPRGVNAARVSNGHLILSP